MDFRKQTKLFIEDPYKFAKRLYNGGKSPAPAFDQEKANDFFSRTYSDNVRGKKYPHPPGLPTPDLPVFPFKDSPPTADEIKSALRKKRNGAAPGPNGLPYLVYKKVPVLLHHLTLILQEMWPNYGVPQFGCGVTSLIYKNGPTDDVSSYRPITVTNTDGKILLSILATRALSYMKNNSYFDISIQKGFINSMAGCVEHTTMLSELLKNAKKTNRQITVCWTDLENAFGSLSHYLIQFALSWYNFPLHFREFVYNYYEGLRIEIRTSEWTTEAIPLLKGVFQGCPLSVQLFNITWNIALDMIRAAPIQGYSMKEADVVVQQLAYVDDQTTIATTPKDAQLVLDTLDNFLSWTACMKAKPHKCRAVAFKVFNNCNKYEPVSETKYSAYDPKLYISGEVIPSLGAEPFKFLGRKISIQNKGNCRN